MTRSHTVPVPSTVGIARRRELLPVLRAALVQQREFRREQLVVYERHGRTWATPAGQTGVCEQTGPTREVDAVVAAGARRVLADIELALDRMASGTYGWCRICDTDIPLAVLRAIPQTTLCLSCLQPAAEQAEPGGIAPTLDVSTGDPS